MSRMESESSSILLTPPPDTAHLRNAFSQQDPDTTHTLSSSSDMRRHTLGLDNSSSDGDEPMKTKQQQLLDDATTTTTTTTTTTKTTTLANLGKDLKHLDNLATLHQSVRDKQAQSQQQHEQQEVLLPQQQQNQKPQVLGGSSLLSASSSNNSITSTSSETSSPGTSSSTEGNYQAISTTTTTIRKRKVRRPTFEARSSRLDPETLTKNQDPFRGFHTLFWIVMGAYGLITFDEEWTRMGKAFGGTLFSSFSQDAIILAISDGGLVLSTGVAFLLIKAVALGWLRYKAAGMVIQHCIQVLFLLCAIAWTIWRDWPWVQSGFFTLHAITMLMKIHSYIAYNGELSEKLIQLEKAEAIYATLKKNDIETVDDISSDENDNGNISSTEQDQATLDSQHRRASEAAAALLHDLPSGSHAVDAGTLASEIEELKYELKTQNGELWPANVTIANFVDYLIVPSLIYELQYPRTSKIRPMYVFEKSVATLGTFTLLYLTTENYIYPVVFDSSISPLRALKLLLIPFMMNYLMIFYIIFECICNAFAELSRFADRNFYEDWWNCVSFDEWARKWNKPVHHFLLRHVYDSSIESFNLSKSNAAFMTFFLSSCVHELVMMVVTRKVRLYLFALQMFQLPLMWMGNHRYIRERPRLANAAFWLAMFCGPPLLGIAYCYA
ncbi:hypothetical protein BGZ94_004614 [Podila epigama]|nr:hypothetical protein BGZ94_004614 [Podila epigama]